MNNNLTNNTIPHRDNADAFSEVQTSQIIDTTSSLISDAFSEVQTSLIYDAFSKAQESEIIDTTSSQLSTLMYTTSPTDTDLPYDSVVFNSNNDGLAPPQYMRQINDSAWVIALATNFGNEFILVQNTMYGNMQLHFIVKDQESQKYNKWYLSVSKENPIVNDMKYLRKDNTDLWEYLKDVRNDWIVYDGGEFSDEEINLARQ